MVRRIDAERVDPDPPAFVVGTPSGGYSDGVTRATRGRPRRRPPHPGGGGALIPTEPILEPVEGPFRALAETFVPEIAGMDRGRWEEVRRLAERGLARRPPSLRRQVVLFVRLLDWLPVLRHGRRFPSLDPRRRTAFLRGLERSRLPPVRRGVWGLRTLAFLGYYGRPDVHAAIGYRAHPDGWEARRAARTAGEGTP